MRLSHYILVALLAACSSQSPKSTVDADKTSGLGSSTETFGSVHRYSDKLDQLLARNAKIEVLAEGFVWTEAPTWVANGGYLLFSQAPKNQVFRWSQAEGLSVYLQPSGLPNPDQQLFRAPGVNGMLLKSDGKLLLANQGERALQELDLQSGQRRTLVSHYQGKRLNGPNDIALASDGSIYFTDLGSGLRGGKGSRLRELDFEGTYRLAPNGELSLIDNAPINPNGVALSPDSRTLYVGGSNKRNTQIKAYALDERGSVQRSWTFFDARQLIGPNKPGLVDGMVVDAQGNIFSSGPGGIYVLNAEGEKLGLISTGSKISNCTLAPDGYLYMTAHTRLVRIKTKSSPQITL